MVERTTTDRLVAIETKIDLIASALRVLLSQMQRVAGKPLREDS